MRSENEIRKILEKLTKQRLTGGPYTELKTIALNTTKQTIKWVLEETETPLTF